MISLSIDIRTCVLGVRTCDLGSVSCHVSIVAARSMLSVRVAGPVLGGKCWGLEGRQEDSLSV